MSRTSTGAQRGDGPGHAGVPARVACTRIALVAALAVPVGVFTSWAAADSGRMLVSLGWVGVSEGSALPGLAVALPGVLLVATIDPTDLADGPLQHTPLPQRFVLAALAGLRLVWALAGPSARSPSPPGWWPGPGTSR